MHHQQQQGTTDPAERLPSEFTILNPVLVRQRIRVVEDVLSDFKADAVFPPITSFLRRVTIASWTC